MRITILSRYSYNITIILATYLALASELEDLHVNMKHLYEVGQCR